MSREIKFRAWVLKDGKMIQHRNRAPAVKMFTPDYGYTNKEVIVMQYTGLKDKNGVEIYEGDIVKGTAIQIEGGFDYFGEVEFITQNTAYGLQITEPVRNGMAGGWSIDQLRTRISLDHITGEVIGNIYENPELLEAEQWP